MHAVWDLPLRIFHWLLLLSIIASYISMKLEAEWLYLHIHIGVFVFALLVFRLCWGFLGTKTSRFGSFFPTPERIHNFYSLGQSHPGHTPHGAIAVLLLLLLLSLQTVTGMFSLDDEVDIHGPLYTLISSSGSEQLSRFHSILFDILVYMIGLHVFAIAYYFFVKRRNLVTPMITGHASQCPNLMSDTDLKINKLSLLISVALSAGLFWMIENGSFVKVINYLSNIN
jgi:cytochrome b